MNVGFSRRCSVIYGRVRIWLFCIFFGVFGGYWECYIKLSGFISLGTTIDFCFECSAKLLTLKLILSTYISLKFPILTLIFVRNYKMVKINK